jgi:hypothetical protein
MNVKQIEAVALKALAGVANGAAAAAALAPQIPQFILAAEDAVHLIEDAAARISGGSKRKLVEAMVHAALDELGLAPQAAAVWAVLSPLVTIIVQLRNMGLLKL